MKPTVQQMSAATSHPVRHHVAIVGSGFSGLAVARHLLSNAPPNLLKVSLIEATAEVGGRAKRGQLASGPVELGATWFHGTEGNPVYDYAMALLEGSKGETAAAAASGSTTPGQATICEGSDDQQQKSKDYTANANGSDPRWELELVAPGEPTPLSGPRHQAILSAFEQYSLAVEDIAEDAEAAAAKVVSTRAPGGGGGTASGSGGSAIPGCSLGQILRARFDSLMSTPVGNDGDSNSISNRSTTKAEAAKQEQGELVVGDQREQKDQSAQQQQQQEEDEGSKGGSDASQPSSISNVAAWLASDGSGLLKRSFAEGWGCRERLQRAYDGFHSSDVAGLAHITEYLDLEGPNIPVPGGYQSIAEALAAEAQGLGLQLYLNCPVVRVLWARPDGRVALRLNPGSAAAKAAFLSNNNASSSISGGSGDDAEATVEVVFDACVFTGSLGVLKTAAGQLFDPPLPATKAAAIDQLHIGQVEKLFVEWPPLEEGEGGEHEAATVKQQQQQQQGGGVQRGGAAPNAAAAGGVAAAPKVPAATPVVGPRKPKQLHDMAPPASDAAAAAAAANAAGAAPSPGAAAAAATTNITGSPEASEPPYTTYCLMWPSQEAVWGTEWLVADQRAEQGASSSSSSKVLQMDVPAVDPVYAHNGGGVDSTAGAAATGTGSDQQQQQQQLKQLPEWLYGLHSWRYGDGPEWIKPGGGATHQQQQQGPQPPSRSAVIWVTGRAAQQMASLSDQQVLSDLELLLQTYPAIPRPADGNTDTNTTTSLQHCKLLRSTWTSSPYTRGSYSYPSAQAEGGSADALAAPLTAADAGVTDGAGDAGSAVVDGSKQKVLVCFAGEATSRIHMGTVHGAFNSGVREANRLLSAWGLLQPAVEGVEDAGVLQAPAEYHAAFWL